jgi:hypothetical protein
MNFDEITTKHLERLKLSIGQTIINKGLDDSGAAIDSLEVQGNKLLGNDYIYFLDQGRGPGKFPPVTNIRDWVRRKLGVEDKEVNGISYVIGRKISREGTSIFNNKSKGIELDNLIDEMLQELYDELPEAMFAQKEVMTWQ